MGPIGSKVAYEYVSRDDPKQTIDSHCSISTHAGNEPGASGKKKKLRTLGGGVPNDVCSPMILCV